MEKDPYGETYTQQWPVTPYSLRVTNRSGDKVHATVYVDGTVACKQFVDDVAEIKGYRATYLMCVRRSGSASHRGLPLTCSFAVSPVTTRTRSSPSRRRGGCTSTKTPPAWPRSPTRIRCGAARAGRHARLRSPGAPRFPALCAPCRSPAPACAPRPCCSRAPAAVRKAAAVLPGSHHRFLRGPSATKRGVTSAMLHITESCPLFIL